MIKIDSIGLGYKLFLKTPLYFDKKRVSEDGFININPV